MVDVSVSTYVLRNRSSIINNYSRVESRVYFMKSKQL